MCGHGPFGIQSQRQGTKMLQYIFVQVRTQREEIMEGSFQKFMLFGIFLSILEVTKQTGSVYIHEYILFTNLKMSWIEAQSYCRAEYGDLGTISDETDISRINDMTEGWNSALWIGLYDDVSSWKWSLVGEHFYAGALQVDYRQWQEDQPDNAGAVEHCVSMMENGFWRDNSCTLVTLPLICFRVGAVDQYVLVTEEKTWFEAQSYCRQHYTDLVSVRSPAESEELRSRLQGVTAVQEAWIGLHRDSWRWSDGSDSSFRRWGENQPNNENNTQACVQMQQGSWDDGNCSTKFSFLCQRITEVTPAPPSESTTIRHASQRRTIVKMNLMTDTDLTDPVIRQKVSQQLEAALNSQGSNNVRLIWRSLKAVPQPQKRDACAEELK